MRTDVRADTGRTVQTDTDAAADDDGADASADAGSITRFRTYEDGDGDDSDDAGQTGKSRNFRTEAASPISPDGRYAKVGR